MNRVKNTLNIKKYISFLLSVVLIALLVPLPAGATESGVEINKSFGGSGSDFFLATTATSDGGTISVGKTDSTDLQLNGLGNGSVNGVIAKYNAAGTLVWRKVFGGIDLDLFNDVVVTPDGGYIAVGEFYALGQDVGYLYKGNLDGLIVKYSSTGTVVWMKSFGGSSNDRLTGVTAMPDGSFIAVGNSGSSDQDLSGLNVSNNNAVIVKYDGSGAIQWTKTFGGSDLDVFTAVTATSSGGAVAVGYSNSTDGQLAGLNKGQLDGIVVNYDSTGNITWKKVFGGTFTDQLFAVTKATDGGYVAVGTSNSYNLDLMGMYLGIESGWIIKLDETGNLDWSDAFGGSETDQFKDIVALADGGYAIAGFSNSTDMNLSGFGFGGFDALTVKYNAAGKMVYTKSYGGSNDDQFQAVTVTTDGSICAVGNSSSSDKDLKNLSKGQVDAYLHCSASPAPQAPTVENIDDKSHTLKGTAEPRTWITIRAGDRYVDSAYVTANGRFSKIIPRQSAGTYIAVSATNQGFLESSKTFTKVTSSSLVSSSGFDTYHLGGSSDDKVMDILSTVDGGYVAVGLTQSSIEGDFEALNRGMDDAFIIKYSKSGSIEWKQVLGGFQSDEYVSVVVTSDGGYVVAGRFRSSDGQMSGLNQGGTDAMLVKYSSTGQLVWVKTFGGTGDDEFNSVISTSDGGYLAVGSSSSTDGQLAGMNQGYSDAIIVKFNASGKVMWKKSLGGSNLEEFKSVTLADNGACIAVGNSYSIDGDFTGSNRGINDGIIVKFSSSGNVLWKRSFGGSHMDLLESIVPLANGVVVLGTSLSSDGDLTGLMNGFSNAIFAAYSNQGNLLWKKAYGKEYGDDFFAATATSDGGFVAVGNTYMSESNGKLVKFDNAWNVVSEISLTGNYNEEFRAVTQLTDGRILVAGYSNSTDGDMAGMNLGGADGIFGFTSIQPVLTGTVSDKSVTVKGSAAKGSTITVTSGNVVIGTAVTDATNKYSVSIAKQPAGAIIGVTSKSTKGIISTATYTTVTDVTAPTAPVLNAVTVSATKVTGTAEAGSQLVVKVGTTQLATGKSNVSGKFSIVIPNQAVGTILSVTATDAAGNVSKSSFVTVKSQ